MLIINLGLTLKGKNIFLLQFFKGQMASLVTIYVPGELWQPQFSSSAWLHFNHSKSPFIFIVSTFKPSGVDFINIFSHHYWGTHGLKQLCQIMATCAKFIGQVEFKHYKCKTTLKLCMKKQGAIMLMKLTPDIIYFYGQLLLNQIWKKWPRLILFIL